MAGLTGAIGGGGLFIDMGLPMDGVGCMFVGVGMVVVVVVVMVGGLGVLQAVGWRISSGKSALRSKAVGLMPPIVSRESASRSLWVGAPE